MRDICKVPLSTEYSVKKLENKLIGNPDWVEMKHLEFPKWFRKLASELNNLDKNGEVPKVEPIFAQVNGEHLASLISHWAQVLAETGQLVELADLPNCPDTLKDKVVLIVGDDSGQGYTR